MASISKKPWSLRKLNLFGQIVFGILIVLIVFSGTEHGWIVRWAGEIIIYIILITVCLTPLYAYLIIKEPFFEAALSKKKENFLTR